VLVVILVIAAAPDGMASSLKVTPGGFGPKSYVVWKEGQGTGQPGKEGTNFALYMQKMVSTATPAAALAFVDGVAGLKLTELGFDVRDGGHCGASAPRFNVIASVSGSAHTFSFGCKYGTHSSGTPVFGWTRVRFGDSDALSADGTAWPGFGNVDVLSIVIIFDEGTDRGTGFVYLDNIDISGIFIDRPESD